MASYKCLEGQGCINNNNGWCKALKKNGLKSVQECNHFDDGTIYTHEDPQDSDVLLETGKVIGKREMLFYLQKACIAKGEPLTLDDINAYSEMLEFQENLYEVEKYESYIVEKDLRETSKRIAKGK